MHEAKMKWNGRYKFEGVSAFGHTIITDIPKKSGGEESGYRPPELLLYGLAGCTGVDVVKILEKMRQKLTGLEIQVKGFQPEEYPKPYNKIEVKYILRGSKLDKNKVEQAIDLSENKYCMVSLSLKGVANIISSYEIIEE
jgi:putative redox protein